jgi:hypothetical protein
MPLRRRFVCPVVLPLALAVLGALSAGARAASPSHGRVPFAAIPEGKLGELSYKNAPRNVAPSERIPSLVVRPDHGSFGLEAERKDGEPLELCYAQLGHPERSDDVAPPKWSGPSSNLFIRPEDGVRALRAERLSSGPDATSIFLDTTTFWFDGATGGARTVAKSRTRFVALATSGGANAVTLFAARETGALQVLVRTVGAIDATSTSGSNLAGDQSMGCSFSRVRLSVDKGEADAANFFASVPAPSDGALGERTRTLLGHVGVSWTSRDAEPIVSAGLAWSGVPHASWGD